MREIYTIANMNDLRYRIAYTVEMLAQAKTVDQLSVNEIVENCGISRMSFYRYFPNKYEVILWIFKTYIDAAIVEESVFSQRTFVVVELMDKKNALFRGSFSKEHQNSLIDDIFSRSETYMINTIKKAIGVMELPGELAFAVNLYLSGARSQWKKFVFGNLRISPETMTNWLLESMPRTIRPYFK